MIKIWDAFGANRFLLKLSQNWTRPLFTNSCITCNIIDFKISIKPFSGKKSK